MRTIKQNVDNVSIATENTIPTISSTNSTITTNSTTTTQQQQLAKSATASAPH